MVERYADNERPPGFPRTTAGSSKRCWPLQCRRRWQWATRKSIPKGIVESKGVMCEMGSKRTSRVNRPKMGRTSELPGRPVWMASGTDPWRGSRIDQGGSAAGPNKTRVVLTCTSGSVTRFQAPATSICVRNSHHFSKPTPLMRKGRRRQGKEIGAKTRQQKKVKISSPTAELREAGHRFSKTQGRQTLQIKRDGKVCRIERCSSRSAHQVVAKSMSTFVKENLEIKLPLCRDENGVPDRGASYRSRHFRLSCHFSIICMSVETRSQRSLIRTGERLQVH